MKFLEQNFYKESFAMKYMLVSFAFCFITAASMGVYAQPGGPASATTQSTKASRVADRALSKQVHTALVKAKIIDAPNIVVRVKNGAVTLAGSVREQSQIDRAGEVTRGVSGVNSVDNALTIRQPGQ